MNGKELRKLLMNYFSDIKPVSELHLLRKYNKEQLYIIERNGYIKSIKINKDIKYVITQKGKEYRDSKNNDDIFNDLY